MSDLWNRQVDMTAAQGPETRKRFPGLFNPPVNRESDFRSIWCQAVNHAV